MLFDLCNKNQKIATFSISTTKYSINCSMLEGYIEQLLPLNLRDLRTWLESRYILIHRSSIKAFYSMLGITTLEEFISITHCISLQDTFWVKEVDCKLSWRNVSPYTSSLNKVVADYSFDRKINGKNITGSPDFSTDGNFPKCWKRVDDILRLYKAGSEGACNAGNEPYSEVYASRIAEIYGYSVSIWFNENGEPIRVHVSKGRVTKNSPKFWLSRNGYFIQADDYSRYFKHNELSRVLEQLNSNASMIRLFWINYHGYEKYCC